MKFEKNETRTGIFVVLTLGILLLVTLLVGAPGLFNPQRTYELFFDNAQGIKAGTPVLLAGRRVGQVTKVYSPVPKQLRPPKAPDAEVYAQVQVSRDAKIYRDANVQMSQIGLLGETVIDFVQGNESSGLAENGHKFVGQRTPDFSEAMPRLIRVLEPVATTATLALDDLRKTIGNLDAFIGKGGPLQSTLEELRLVASNLTEVTAKDGPFQQSFLNVQQLTATLKEKNGPFQTSLANIEATSQNTKAATDRLNTMTANIKPTLETTVKNAEQMTDTLKRQPWRILWPSTKKYSDEVQTNPSVQQQQPKRDTRATSSYRSSRQYPGYYRNSRSSKERVSR